MQVKLKPCAGEDCNGALRQIWKQFENNRYCKNCWHKIKPPTPLKQSALPKTQKPIAKESPKRKKESILYSTMRKVYLDQHPQCEINIPGVCSHQNANQIHHTYSGKDRDKYFLDTATWKATEQNCHDWVHTHPIEAREMGYLK